MKRMKVQHYLETWAPSLRRYTGALTRLGFKFMELGVYKLRHNSHEVEDGLQSYVYENSMRVVNGVKRRVLGHQLHRHEAKGSKNEKVDYDKDFCEWVYVAYADVTECPWANGFDAYHRIPDDDPAKRTMSINGKKLSIVP